MSAPTLYGKPLRFWTANGSRPLAFTSEPDESELPMLSKLGYERCGFGERYRKEICCPVNGDGYWTMRIEILNACGEVIGSSEIDWLVGENKAS